MIFHRLANIPKNRSFFLFGARGTGKSTLITGTYESSSVYYINLLDLEVEARFAREPMALQRDAQALPATVSHIVIDEIQKQPKLLDVVHNLIETYKIPQSFVLTGSSARKLKTGGANLLAGRAAVRSLYPFTSSELGAHYDEEVALRFGLLPKIWNTSDNEERHDILRAYANTYLKEEVWGEQLVRHLDPFRRFLEVAAIQSGKILNYSKIARDVGADVKTVQSWYEILQDTLLGFYLDAWHTSVRKQLRQAPKFYFFDTGVMRALARMLNVEPVPQTNYFGDIFEHLVIQELIARNAYENLDYQFSYLHTKSQVEVDLVVKRPGKALALIEIKSAQTLTDDHFRSLNHFVSDFPDADFFLWSRDPRPQQRGRIKAVDWKTGLWML